MPHLDDDDEATTFEQAPLGARQRLIPSTTFVAKRAHLALGSGEQPAVREEATVAAEPLVIAETATETVDTTLETVEGQPENFEPTTAEWLAMARAAEASSKACEPTEWLAKARAVEASTQCGPTTQWLAKARAVEASLLSDPSAEWLMLARAIDASRAGAQFAPSARLVVESTARVEGQLRDGSANFPPTAEWLAVARAVEASSGWVVSGEESSGWMASSESSTVLVTASSTALPIRRRRDRLTILALAVVGLLVLGGAALPPDLVADETPAVELRGAIDRVLPSVHLPSFEAAPPIAEVESASLKKAPQRHAINTRPRGRKVTVDASSPLGGLRPRRAW